MRAYKYTNFTNTEELIKTALSTLPYNEFLGSFSVALTNKSKSIVLAGGTDSRYEKISAKAFMMPVTTGKW